MPEVLVWAVTLKMDMADEMDDRLRAEVGGRRFFDDPEASAGTTETGTDGHPALLTIVELTADDGTLTPAEVARICGHDRGLVLNLIADCEAMSVQWRKSAGETDDATEREDGTAQARCWDETATLQRAALREIVLG